MDDRGLLQQYRSGVEGAAVILPPRRPLIQQTSNNDNSESRVLTIDNRSNQQRLPSAANSLDKTYSLACAKKCRPASWWLRHYFDCITIQTDDCNWKYIASCAACRQSENETRNPSGDEIANVTWWGPTVRYDKTYRRCHFSVYLFILQLYK